MKTNLLSLIFVILSIQVYSQIKWEHTNGPEGGTFSAITSNDSFAFYSDIYKLYRTSDGINWQQLPYENLWPLEVNNTKIVALQGHGYNLVPSKQIKFLVSYDNGLNWIEGKLPPIKNNGVFSNMTVCSHGIYVLDEIENRIYKTIDDGKHWGAISTPGKSCHKLYSFEDQLYASWFEKYSRLSSNMVDWEQVSPNFGDRNHPNGIFISGQIRIFSTQNNIIASTDGGLNWNWTTIDFYNSEDHFIQIGNRIYKLGNLKSLGLLYSEDLGIHWIKVNNNQNYTTYDLTKAGGKLLANAYNVGIISFDESINKFIPANKGLFSASVYNLESKNDFLWAASGNGIFAYDLKSDKWMDQAKLPFFLYRYTQATLSKSGYLACIDATGNKIYLSKDQGNTWEIITSFGMNITHIYWLDDVLMLNTEITGGYRSNDLGKTWKEAFCPNNIVSFNGKFFGLNKINGIITSSSDLGKNWTNLQGPGSNVNNLFASEDKLFALTIDDKNQTTLFYSEDVINWKYANDGLPSFSTYLSPGSSTNANLWFKDGKYYLFEPKIGLFLSIDSCRTWLPIEKGEYTNFVITDSLCFAGRSGGGGVLKCALPQNYGSVLTGIVFKDDNNNGIHENNEVVIPKIKIGQIEPGAWYPYSVVTSSLNGSYSIENTLGIKDTLRVELNAKYPYNINPVFHITNENNSNYNFGIHFVEEISDVSINGALAGHPRPGSDLITYINYQNEGTDIQAGKISLKFDSNYKFLSANPKPDAVYGHDSLVWNFNKLSLFESRKIQILGQTNLSATLGSLIKIRGHVKTTFADDFIQNDNFELNENVVDFYDPNDKEVEPSNGLTSEEIAAGKELIYTIRFQNTGNFQADQVRITDHLDTAFNLKSLRFVSSSHPISQFKLLPGGLLHIIFNNMALTYKSNNDAASQGYVKFAIQLNKSINPGYKLINQAHIYFDNNSPIITNSTQTEVLTGTEEINDHLSNQSENNLIIIPNPAKDIIQINSNYNFTGPIEISLINTDGNICLKEILPNSSKPWTINIKNLQNGFYFLSLKSNQKVFSKKLVVSH